MLVAGYYQDNNSTVNTSTQQICTGANKWQRRKVKDRHSERGDAPPYCSRGHIISWDVLVLWCKPLCMSDPLAAVTLWDADVVLTAFAP